MVRANSWRMRWHKSIFSLHGGNPFLPQSCVVFEWGKFVESDCASLSVFCQNCVGAAECWTRGHHFHVSFPFNSNHVVKQANVYYVSCISHLLSCRDQQNLRESHVNKDPRKVKVVWDSNPDSSQDSTSLSFPGDPEKIPDCVDEYLLENINELQNDIYFLQIGRLLLPLHCVLQPILG